MVQKKFLHMNKEKRLLLTKKKRNDCCWPEKREKIVYYPKEEVCSWNVFQYPLYINWEAFEKLEP